MKTAYITTTFPCQSETFVLREILQLQKTGLEITVFAVQKDNIKTPYNGQVFYRPPRFSKFSLYCIFELLKKHPLSFWVISKLFFYSIFRNPKEALTLITNIHTIAAFAKLIEDNAIEHIHACFLSFPAVIALAISKITNIDFSISAHARDIYTEKGNAKLKITNASFVAVCNQAALKHLENTIPAELSKKLFLIHHGIEIPKIGPDNLKNKYSIVAIARLAEKKGLKYLVRAMKLVTEQEPSCKLTMIGQGPENKTLISLTQKLGISENITFAGQLEHRQTLNILSSASALIVPSIIAKDNDRDGIPNVIIEAFISKTPVIASELPSIKEVITHNKIGLLVPCKNPEKIAHAIIKLLNNNALSNRLSENGFKFALQNFNIEKNAGLLAKLFDLQKNEKQKNNDRSHHRTISRRNSDLLQKRPASFERKRV